MPNFFERVYDVVKKIPAGKVMTYGQVAELVGTKDARKVGFALHANNKSEVPCHRVVNKEGKLAENFAFNGIDEITQKTYCINYNSDKNKIFIQHITNYNRTS